MGEEQVMVVPSDYAFDVGVRSGLVTDGCQEIIHKLLYGRKTRFMNRSMAESDSLYKQIIPYVVFTCGDRVFAYVRGNRSGEKRLHGHRAIGIGGHINRGDAVGYVFHCSYYYDAYMRGMGREVREEVSIDGRYVDRACGLIFTDETDVGRVHVGIMHHVVLRRESCIRPNSYEITDSKFMSIDELSRSPDLVDDWAILCIPLLLGLLQ